MCVCVCVCVCVCECYKISEETKVLCNGKDSLHCCRSIIDANAASTATE